METLKNVMASVVIAIGILMLTGWINEREAEIEAMHQADAGCIPQDEGEVAIQRIVNGIIQCEKHVRIDYPHVQMPTLACPIKGACDADTVIHLTDNSHQH